MTTFNSLARMRWLFAVLALAIAATALPMPSTRAQTDTRLFPETGKTVSGKFLSYWNRNGGLAQQGYPISEEINEVSETDGKPYTMQYFERAVFELHPENRPPNDVLLSLLGTQAYKQKYPNGAPGQTPNTSTGSVLFRETGKRLGGVFLQYWNRNGGLAQQGYPISDEFIERSPVDGKEYRVQYFERAVFELHPENRPPNDVLLSLLGALRYKAKYATSAPPPASKLSQAQRQDLLLTVWETVRDEYVYTDFRGLDWPAIYNEYKAKVAAAANDMEVYSLISEMITRLGDRHSSFNNPQEVAEDEALRRGDLKVSGIGVFSQEISSTVRIVYVIPNSPADKAGLKAFDIIRAADGTPLTRNEDAPRLIRGPPGTSVTLTVETPGSAPRNVTIVRETVTFAFHAQAQRLPGTNIAYLNLPSFFTSGIAAEAGRELERLAASGPIDGVIIDIRQNGGGLLVELHGMLGLFINGGSAGYDVTRRGRNENRIPSGRVLRSVADKPIVVLTSSASESASDRFAAVMQDYKRATILGTNTAGNTETVYVLDMPFGTQLNLARATYVRIDGKTTVEDKGVTPDIVLDVPWYNFPREQDPQVLAAIKHIQGR